MTLVSSHNYSRMVRVSAASPPVTGHFDLAWNGHTLGQLAANLSAGDLALLLESIPGFGRNQVTRSKDCAGFKWRVRWENGGDKLPLTVARHSLLGESVAISARKYQQGGVNFSPIRGEMLRTYSDAPQVRRFFTFVYSRG